MAPGEGHMFQTAKRHYNQQEKKERKKESWNTNSVWDIILRRTQFIGGRLIFLISTLLWNMSRNSNEKKKKETE
jgi:hypothetical protein